MTMILVSSTLQIRRHEYSGDLNIVILVMFVAYVLCRFMLLTLMIRPLFLLSGEPFSWIPYVLAI
ncbi:transmembrane protein, putative [Medicago truncatula]|uniref:Transmembrane protein, putative n=1 Tax=Medicago truncatula TaxID=3880 RepID=G7K833_MEDTR|nr:transmembrane protein, putative [Medicago truncatula]